MSKSGARIIGINRLIKRLNLIPDAVFDEAEKTITEHSQDIAARAAALAPVEEGELRRKIKARKVKKKKTSVTGAVWSGAPHGINVEYGDSDQTATPHLRPAARRAERVAQMTRAIQAAFKKT